MDWVQELNQRAIEQGLFYGFPAPPDMVARLIAISNGCSGCNEAVVRHITDARMHHAALHCVRSWSEIRMYTYDEAGRMIHAIDMTCERHGTHGEAHWVQE